MKMVRNFLLISGMILVSGCSVFDSFSEVDALNETQAVGSPFTQALADEYRIFANRELREMFDYPDALHFARKGLAAASGESVTPEPITDWNLEEPHIQELSAARGRLMVAFDLGAREVAPREAAYTQAMFDCWIEQQEENWQDNDIVNCKTAFADAIVKLEGMLQPPAPAPEPAPEPMAPEDAVYLVFFNWDSQDLGSGALNVLDAVATEVAKNPPSQINIVGHADTSGPRDYNQKLASKRANAVRDALIQRGVDANILMVDSRGESELLVETPDNVREPANRRVNITFE
ncbi:MAG: cell envelope biogenesis protein OmpA [Micavibrio sp.]|nr:cell envelope biogenesis protein OmpA [Micavibrio sp.]|tara:strand:- start:1575 stop:2447 length:873 start_codon:yes stop_codon:yes gene_type:complete